VFRADLLAVNESDTLSKQFLTDSSRLVLAPGQRCVGPRQGASDDKRKSPAGLAAETSSEDTLSFIRRVKRTTRRKYTPEEKVRIMTATAMLVPIGFLMGMPFPIGMKMASLRPNAPTAFLWGINGAMSVCASVLAVVVALSWGISTAF